MKTLSKTTYPRLLGVVFFIFMHFQINAAFLNASIDGSGILNINTNNSQTILNLRVSGNSLIIETKESLGSPAVTRSTYALNLFKIVRYIGSDAIDLFTATGLNIPVIAIGNGGNDILTGGNADDSLIGGAGTDSLIGNDGDDTLIGIDGALGDNLQGGAGKDIYWSDLLGGQRDGINLEAGDVVHPVSRFANGADLTLNGDNLRDPAINTEFTANWVYQNMRGKPLFSAQGPKYTDINQGGGGNCKIVASLSSLAFNVVSGNAWIVQRAMADFGDGTFGVKLGNNYYRVDGDLPNGMAKAGPQGSIWTAIAEKALCFYAPRTNGVIQWQDLFSIGPESVFIGFGAQTSTGLIIGQQYASPQDMLVKLETSFNGYQNVVFTLGSATANGVHAYTFMGVVKEGGKISGVKFRNPWGIDGNANGYNDGNPNDGIITLTAQQIWQDANGGRAYIGSRIQ
jgi:hypothetical protein